MYIMLNIVYFKKVITFIIFYVCTSYTMHKVTLKTKQKKQKTLTSFYSNSTDKKKTFILQCYFK